MLIRFLYTFRLRRPLSTPLSDTFVPVPRLKLYVHTASTVLDELMNVPKSPPDDAEPFQPPNLLQSPAASFLSIFESSTHVTPATLLLLPLAHVPPPVPSELERHSGPEMQDEWEPFILAKLHRIVCSILCIDSSWSTQNLPERSTPFRASRRGDIGEGGMYL